MKNKLIQMIPDPWKILLADTLEKEEFALLADFLEKEYSSSEIYPPFEDIFHSLRLTPPEKIKAVLLGQDPYHGEGQAHGLAFSVKEGVKHPASLRNIFREYASDTSFPVPRSGSLVPWAEEGVLLLNTVLTVRAHEANSHKGHYWESFTDDVIRKVNLLPQHIVFLLWGTPAQKKLSLIDQTKHTVLCNAHPSPLSAYRGFFSSRPFSRTNAALAGYGIDGINWDLSPDKKCNGGK